MYSWEERLDVQQRGRAKSCAGRGLACEQQGGTSWCTVLYWERFLLAVYSREVGLVHTIHWYSREEGLLVIFGSGGFGSPQNCGQVSNQGAGARGSMHTRKSLSKKVHHDCFLALSKEKKNFLRISEEKQTKNVIAQTFQLYKGQLIDINMFAQCWRPKEQPPMHCPKGNRLSAI